ncbi:MAG: Gfo/Idh/MocA family oxidoreductase [Ruminococcus flavefaciens]|nr:Gfo/Idh/MocA family oxidoreductase [Ruminococcus flavefaciens]
MKKVITYGTFDLFHEGHYNLLKRAKALGDYLIVGITTEQYDEFRGKLNVVDSLLTRIDNVRDTGFVDEIVIEDHEGQKIEDIQKYDVNIFTVGSDWRGKFDYLKEYCEVVYLERTRNVSSSMRRREGSPIVKIGIAGTGRVAGRFPQEAQYVSGVVVSGVFNPNGEHAREFAEKKELSFGESDYERFLDKVDAVYVASPHETHYEYTKLALEHGKHVLCEKPMVFKRTQAEELFELARTQKCALMEAIKTAYCPGFNQLITVAQSGIIGEIRDVEASFSRLTAPDLREMIDTRYGGAFTEFGSYTLLPILKLLGREYRDIRFDSLLNDNGIDGYTKVSFVFDNGLALSKTGVSTKTEGQLLIAGTKGYILVKSPWWQTRSFEVRFENPNEKEVYASKFLGRGLRYEISDFARAINGDKNRAYKLTRGESIAMAEVMEKFLKQANRYL